MLFKYIFCVLRFLKWYQNVTACSGQYFIINKLNSHSLITVSLQMPSSHTPLKSPTEKKTEVQTFTVQMCTGYKLGLWHFLLSNLPKASTKVRRTLKIQTESRYQQNKILITHFCGKRGLWLGFILLCCFLELCMRQLLAVIFSWLFHRFTVLLVY